MRKRVLGYKVWVSGFRLSGLGCRMKVLGLKVDKTRVKECGAVRKKSSGYLRDPDSHLP